MAQVIKSPNVPWTVEIDGKDLVVRNVKATCFGGKSDLGDNGETESGVKNYGDDPKLMGIALPIRSTEKATKGSPLAFKGPHIPWGTKVLVWQGDDESKAIECILIDNGPDVEAYPSHALDLNPNVAHYFAPEFDVKKLANDWSGKNFSYRVINGALFIS